MAVMRPPQAMDDLGRKAWETSWWRMKDNISNCSSFRIHHMRQTSLKKGTALALLSDEDGVYDNPMKVPKGGITN